METQCQLAAFVEENRPMFAAFCSRLTGGRRAAAQDLLGDMELKLVEVFARGEKPGSPRSWCFAVLTNLWRDQQRRAKRAGYPSAPLDTEQRDDRCLQRGLEYRESLRRCERELQLLPERQVRALLLRVVGGLDYAELARRLGVTEGNARKLVQLARRSLTAESV